MDLTRQSLDVWLNITFLEFPDLSMTPGMELGPYFVLKKLVRFSVIITSMSNLYV